MLHRGYIGLAAIAAAGCASPVWDWTPSAESAAVGQDGAPAPPGFHGNTLSSAAEPDAAPAPSPNWWHTHAGMDTTDRDSAVDVAVDPRGRAIVLARLAGRAFGILAYEPGGTIAWTSTYRDPSDDADLATKLAIDTAGNIYAAGSWERAASPLGGFLVVAFDSTGALRWSARSDGGGALSGLAVDGKGHVVVTGNGTDGTRTLARTIAYDAGGSIAWAASEPGPFGLGATGRDVALDANANAYVAGESSDGSQNHLTVFAYDATGTRLWATRNEEDPDHVPQTTAQALALDVSGAPHVAFARAFRTTRDAEPRVTLAVSKYDRAGRATWTAVVDQATRNIATAMAVDSEGRVTVTGFAGNPSPDSYLTVQLDAAGQLRWAERYAWGGAGADQGRALALDGSGNAYVAGTAYGNDGIARFGSIAYDSSGNVLFRKLDGDSSNANSLTAAIAVDTSAALYVVGSVLSIPHGVVGVLRSSR
jgi:hypothetical protein